MQYLLTNPSLDYDTFASLYEKYYFISRPDQKEQEIVAILEKHEDMVKKYWKQVEEMVKTEKSKKFYYDWEEFEDGGKDSTTMIEEILADPQLPELEEIVVGCWGECYDNDAQNIVDGIVEHKEKFQQVKHLFIGDMEMEECEVSWIEQANYEKIWEALPNLEKLTIKGSTGLLLGDIKHQHLKELEIICGGLPKNVIQSIARAELPELTSLTLYIGVDGYGFDGSIDDIKALLAHDFPKLTKLALVDSEIQDQIAAEVVKSKYMDQITELALSMGSLSDEGGALLLEEVPKHPNIVSLDLEYHYMSEEMMEQLSELPIEVNVEDQQEDDEYDGTIYRYPLLTE